jgi:hypothetical protein
MAFPNEGYRVKASEVSQLRVALISARSNNSASVAGLEQALATAEKELDSLGAKVREYDAVLKEEERMQTLLTSADERLARTEARVEANKAETAVTVGDVVEIDRRATLARQIVAASGAGLLVAVVLLLVFETLRSRRVVVQSVEQPTVA